MVISNYFNTYTTILLLITSFYACTKEEYDVVVHSVKVAHIKPGFNWDQDNNADLYFEIFTGDVLKYHQDTIVWNAVTSLPHDFEIEEFTLEEATKKHQFLLLDYDPIGVDTLEVIDFVPHKKHADEFPPLLRLTSPEGTEIEMEVTYVPK